PELIACPTCGRLAIDLEDIIAKLEQRLGGRKTPVKISVLGCVVNGPGEAREADIGIAAGNGKGVIFRTEEMVRNVRELERVDALMEEGEGGKREHPNGKPAEKPDARVKLPLVTSCPASTSRSVESPTHEQRIMIPIWVIILLVVVL